VLELSEHAKHLQHHPAGRGPSVERLGGGAQDHAKPVQFLGNPCELANLPAQSVDPVDEQLVDTALPRKVERGLQAGPVELGAGGAVFVVGNDPPVSCTLQNASRRSCWEASDVGWFSSSVEMRV
jgi:hypothetical protein